MKSSFLFLGLTILFYSCSTKQKNSLKEWNLNGNVESVVNQSYEGKYENGKIIQGDKGYSDNYKVNFDKEGFIVERINLSSDGGNRDKSTFTFKDNKISEIKNYNSSNTLETHDFYEYKSGLLSKVVSKDGNGLVKNTYDLKKNNKEQNIEGTRFDENGTKVGN
jgi:hypothetical protein